MIAEAMKLGRELLEAIRHLAHVSEVHVAELRRARHEREGKLK